MRTDRGSGRYCVHACVVGGWGGGKGWSCIFSGNAGIGLDCVAVLAPFPVGPPLQLGLADNSSSPLSRSATPIVVPGPVATSSTAATTLRLIPVSPVQVTRSLAAGACCLCGQRGSVAGSHSTLLACLAASRLPSPPPPHGQSHQTSAFASHPTCCDANSNGMANLCPSLSGAFCRCVWFIVLQRVGR
jgi:hypothetical protein